ncbi:DUF11 domain-containing protein [Spirosoma sp. KUDC1026]|nr:DUF11 domain-containing protein [Spirosoma sp. KUDC1026]
MVIQRNNNDQATIQIVGSYAQAFDMVEARIVARAVGQGTSTDWSPVQTLANGQFQGQIVASGGWYRIEVRGSRNGQIVASDAVERFGVGEVLAIVGHSNAQGTSCIVGGTDRCPTIDGAADDRVTVVGLDQSTPEFRQYELTAQTQYLPGLAFSQLLTRSGMSPFASIAWFWGRMGDLLVQRMNVPVLIYNAGFGGTNMEHNYKAAYDIPFEHGFVNYSIRMPYANLRNLMNLYVVSTGIRAVLLNHGENDRGNATSDILMHHYGVIDKSRAEFSKPDLAWIIALSSFASAPFDNVRQAQAQVIGRAGYRTYQGPDLDQITSLEDRPDGIHYSPTGQVKAAQRWADAISDNVLQSITPYEAQSQPLVSITCADGQQLALSQPDGYSYAWNTGSGDKILTVGAGSYSARITDGQKRQFFPPSVTVPSMVRPGTPTISLPGGSSEICRTTGLVLSSSYDGPNRWSTGVTAPSITVTAAGIYSLQAQHPAYGCLSNSVSKIINLATADLSLRLDVSRHSLVVGDTVRFTLTVRNESTCDAASTTVRNRLPANVAFVSSTNMSLADGAVSGTIAAVPAGGTVSLQYVARLTAPGNYLNAAELSAQTNLDPDSQPNSGTGDGQDDTAQADLRTSSDRSTSDLFVSPNPNQIPLASVQSNQPAPDPAKADLSLIMKASNRIVKSGQPVTFTLTVNNLGGQTATNVRIQNPLPTGLEFVGASGMNQEGSAINATIGQITPNQSVSVTFVARVTGRGTISNAAQITASDQPDPDSTPGNGLDKGEDDEARTDLRVVE